MNYIKSTLLAAFALAATTPLMAQKITFPFPPAVDPSTIDFDAVYYTSAADKSSTPIVNVIGTGPNFAALVVDFNDGASTATTSTQESYIWGYRWEGTKVVEDMLRDIVAADPALFWFEGTAGSFGVPLYGIAYDSDQDLNPAVSFFNYGAATQPPTTGPWVGADADNNLQNDPDDQYESGFFTDGFWGLFSSDDMGVSFMSAFTGISGLTIADGQVMGLAWQPGPTFSGPSPDGWVSAPLDQLPAVAFNGGTMIEFTTGEDLELIIGFNEIMTDVDASDLVTTGSAVDGSKATASVGSPVQINDTTWSFPISNAQSGTLNYTLAPDAGDIQDLQANDLAPVSHSITVTETASITDWVTFD